LVQILCDSGSYQYSVVTDNNQLSLFVLARDIETFKSDYEAEVLDFLESNGFTGYLNSPIETNHDDCSYLSAPTGKVTHLRGN